MKGGGRWMGIRAALPEDVLEITREL